MKKITLLILSMLLIGSVFARHHKRKKDKQPNSITSVSIHRTACYGRCPDYLVQISNDGTAIYTGKRFTADTGIFKKNIGTNHFSCSRKKKVDKRRVYSFVHKI